MAYFCIRYPPADFHFMAIIVTHGCVAYSEPFNKYVGRAGAVGDLEYLCSFILGFFLNALGFTGRNKHELSAVTPFLSAT
jgi:hypothetical protein